MNAEASNQKVGWMTVFSVVAVWFGAHAGGGFASGNQEMNFFVQYGWPALITPIISMIVLAIVYRVIVTMCNQHNSNHYRAWADHLYSPHEKVISPIYEVCNLGAGMLATSASVAGAAAIIKAAGAQLYAQCDHFDDCHRCAVHVRCKTDFSSIFRFSCFNHDFGFDYFYCWSCQRWLAYRGGCPK